MLACAELALRSRTTLLRRRCPVKVFCCLRKLSTGGANELRLCENEVMKKSNNSNKSTIVQQLFLFFQPAT